MRGSLSRARLLVLALAAALAVAMTASSALANSATTSANGAAVTASLSPDSVSKSQTVTQTATVKNISGSSESLAVQISGPLSTSAPTVFFVKLAPNATFSKSLSFSADLLSQGTHRLTVTAVNRETQAATRATASITVT
jgi:hypothetical protein